jgi:hypothetical protein
MVHGTVIAQRENADTSARSGATRFTSTLRDAALFGAVAVLGVVTLAAAVTAQFVLVDDHEILRLSQPDAGSPLSILVGIVTQSDPVSGRFRPVYWAMRLGLLAVFGTHPLGWHVTMLLVGLAAAGMLYATCRVLRVQRVAAALLAAWLLVAPGVSSVWVRLGTNETPATFFLVGAMLCASMAARSRRGLRWEALFVTSALLAMLSKESYALTGPALGMFRILAGRVLAEQRRWPTSALLVAVLGVVLAACDFAIAAWAGDATYGGAFLVSPPVGTYALNFLHNLGITLFAGIGWPGVLALPRWRRLGGVSGWALGAVLVLIVPQLVLYSREGILEGKYELPSALAVAASVIAGLVWLQQAGRTREFRAGLSLFGVTVGLFAISTHSYAAYFTEDSRQLQRMVQYVAQTAPMGAVVGVAGNPSSDYEPILSVVDQFAAAGRSDLEIAAVPVQTDAPQDARAEARVQMLYQTLHELAPLSTCSAVSVVILLPDAWSSEAALPCREGYDEIEFTSSATVWGSDHVNLRPQLPELATAGLILLQRLP